VKSIMFIKSILTNTFKLVLCKYRQKPKPGEVSMVRDHTKLKELILYIAEKCEGWGNWGATMLNKILFFSDFIAYAKYGESITGEDYFKLPKGPAPKYLVAAREQLERAEDAVVQKKPTLRGIQDRLIPLREPELSYFKAEQIAIVDYVIDELKNENSDSVSGLSHTFYGWQTAKDKEIIPYNTVFLKEPVLREMPSAVRIAIAKLAKKHGSRQAI